MIAGCYRRDEAQNPELFADALALVLGDYPADIVKLAVDPRTGIIEKFPMGLPNVGQIKGFLDELQARQERLKHLAALPKHQRYQPPPLVSEPNLFVPDDNRRYQEMVTKADAQPERARFEQGHVCTDKVQRNGVWIPLDWWESGADMQGSKRAEELSRLHFERDCKADGVTIGGQPISKDLAAKLGVTNADVA